MQEAAQSKLVGSNFVVSKTAACELRVESVIVQIEQGESKGLTDVRVSWAYSDDYLGSTILQSFQAM